MKNKQAYRGGFALPTVLIASVIMLIVLSVAVSSVSAIRTTLKTQYYEQLAKTAGEAGVAYAKACLSKNGNVPLWTDEKPLRPNTDCAGNSLLSPEIQVLVVAGGGGGGNNHGGGGGGGGVVTNNAFSVSGGQSYAVSVGAGGAGGTTTNRTGVRGVNSSFASLIIAQGGGGGGGRINTNSVSQAGSGGSGGGGAGTIDGATSLPALGANGTSGQGFMGGNGSSGATAGNGGGGGGAGGAGGVASGSSGGAGVSGDGGNGSFSDISGSVVYYGAGGSGGRWGAGAVGLPGVTGGGSGDESNNAAGKPGQDTTGGGGGGGGGGSANGGAGGSGVVYVRYANNGTINATGGSVEPYTSGPYKIHAFRNTGTSTFTVNSATDSVCPSDPRCSVVVNNTLRSSFSVPRPLLDANGRALTIANTGYVELLRTSSGEVWRTYRQPSVQAAAVPDLCSGAATSGLGWKNAAISSTQGSISGAPQAKTITLADNPLAAGIMYFRKDFTVLEAGTYDLSFLANTATSFGEIYIDGSYIFLSAGSLAKTTINLGVGCHTITVRLTNKALTPSPATFAAAIGRPGMVPIIYSDATWRVSSGNSVHFSQSDFYADSSLWTNVISYPTPSAQALNTTWGTISGDPFTQMVSPLDNYCSADCPNNSSGYMRDSQDVYVSSPTEVKVTALCDNDCSVFMDGQVVLSSAPWASINQQSFTMTPGHHRFAIRLYNSGPVPNESGAAVTVVDQGTGAVLTRTDLSWFGARQWVSGKDATTASIQSYEASFRPSPNDIPVPVTFDFLAVGGGGGGGSNSAGGGGAGGVTEVYGVVAVANTTYTVTIGAGGLGSTNNTTNGTKGADTMFGNMQMRGGGFGASRDGGLAAASGGSGGGGAGATVALRVPGAGGTFYQGSSGGQGTAADAGVNATGGGGGGVGGPGLPGVSGITAGNGGPGRITYITGSRLAVGGGGAGSATTNGSMGNATDGGGVGTSTATLNGVTNTGGGGGARSGAAAGGNGGSGVIIIRVKTGSMNVSVTGTPVTTSVTIMGVPYTVYRFNSNGSFRINSIN